jgi:hypothetical protein
MDQIFSLYNAFIEIFCIFQKLFSKEPQSITSSNMEDFFFFFINKKKFSEITNTKNFELQK